MAPYSEWFKLPAVLACPTVFPAAVPMFAQYVLDLNLDAPLAATYCNMRKASIYGGSNEIQNNIITQMILGL